MNKERWSRFLKDYDPLKAGSIDGTDSRPHDRGIERAMESTYVPNKDIESDATKTLFVARLSPETTEEGLDTTFSKFGVIKSLSLIRDIVTGFSKQYAFIEFEMRTDAEEACDQMHSGYIDNHTVFVDWECGRTLPKWIPRRLGGGFSGKKESGQLRFGGKDRPFKKPFIIRDRQGSPDGHTGGPDRFQSEREKGRRRGDSLGRESYSDRVGYRDARDSRGESYSRERYRGNREDRERDSDRRDSRERVRIKQEPGGDGYKDTREWVRLKREHDGEWYEDTRRSPRVRIKQEERDEPHVRGSSNDRHRDIDMHRDRRRSRSRERDRRRSRSRDRRRSRDRSRERGKRAREASSERERSQGRRRFTEVKTEEDY